VDADHSFITPMFEEKMNYLLKSTKEKQPSKKRINPSGRLISKFFSIKHTFKKEDVSQRIFRGPWFVNCQEQFTYPVCGEYVTQTFNSSSLSKIKLPFYKVIFTRHIARVSGKDK
jgi:hypothetical protein